MLLFFNLKLKMQYKKVNIIKAPFRVNELKYSNIILAYFFL